MYCSKNNCIVTEEATYQKCTISCERRIELSHLNPFLTINQCDQIEHFLKFLATNFPTKVAENFLWWLIWLFQNHHFLSKNCWGLLFGKLSKIGLLLIPTLCVSHCVQRKIAFLKSQPLLLFKDY